MPTDIYIDDVIGKDFFGDGITAQSVREQLDAMPKGDQIRLRINSGGGDVFEANSIVAECKRRGGYMAVVDGLAASAGSFIAVQATELQMAEGAWMMIHNPHTIAAGDYREMQETATLLARFAEKYAQAYARKTGKSLDEIQSMLDDETWLSDDEAVAEGFADSIADYAADEPKLAAIFQAGGKLQYKHMPDMAKRITDASRAALQLRSLDARLRTLESA